MDARALAQKVLADVEAHEKYAHLALPAALSRTQLDERERAMATELVYGVLRRKLTLDWLVDEFASRPAKSLDPTLLIILELGVYQLVFLEKIPDHAAVGATVDLAKKIYHQGIAGFVNGVLRAVSRNRDKIVWPDREKDPAYFYSVFYSHPKWLVELWLNQLGPDETTALLTADNVRPKVTLRANTMKNSRLELMAWLTERGATVRPGIYSNDAIVVETGRVPDECFRLGLSYAQDEASIAVGHIVDPAPGQTVIDLCAGPGGKATHLAQLMEDRGKVIAVDIHQSRLDLIKKNAMSLGVGIIKPTLGDALNPLPLPEAESVLVDAPCSGLGVLARRPDMRWRKSPNDVPVLAGIQGRLLEAAQKYVKPGGHLTYSVCTMTLAETENVLERFLDNNPSYKVAKKQWFWPHKQATDGMFIAMLQRTH